MKLNSTGSCWVNDNGVYYSYAQPLTASYKGRCIFDEGFYSMTTRKHQSIIRNYIPRNYVSILYGDLKYDVEFALKKEIENIDYEIETRLAKRKTKNNLNEIEKLQSKREFISNLLNE